MKTWTKEEAIENLKSLSDEAEVLKRSTAFSTEHTLWITKCVEVLDEVFGRASMYFSSFIALNWRPTDGTIVDPLRYGGDYEAAVKGIHREAFIKQLGTARGLLLGAITSLKQRKIEEVYKGENTEPEASLIIKVFNLAEHQLRKVIRKKPENEREVQKAFENLLIGSGIPYGRESERIEYSSKTYTPDFTLSKASLVVEIKLCNRDGREKEIIAEINDDILAYQTKYSNLCFVVYDSGGSIRDKDKFSGSFSEQTNVSVKVIKH